MNVKAAKGLKVPMEGAPHKYITDAKFVTVADSMYYKRRVNDGDLVVQGQDNKAKGGS